MPLLLRSCCGCCELRVGVIIIAIIELCMATYGIYETYQMSDLRGSTTAKISNSTLNTTVATKSTNSKERTSFITGASVGAVDVIVSALLLFGAISNKPKFRLLNYIWIAWTALVIALFLVAMVVLSLAAKTAMAQIQLFITYGGGIMLQLYCILVVYSYHRQLQNQALSLAAREHPVYYVPAQSQPDLQHQLPSEQPQIPTGELPPSYEVAVGLPPAYTDHDFTPKEGKSLLH